MLKMNLSNFSTIWMLHKKSTDVNTVRLKMNYGNIATKLIGICRVKDAQIYVSKWVQLKCLFT